MATLLYMAMRRLWNDEKRKLKHPKYGYEDDAEDYTSDSFSEHLFFNEEENEEEHEEEHVDEHQDDPNENPVDDPEEKDQSPDNNTKQYRENRSEKSTQTDQDDLEITVSICLKSMELTIPAGRARVVLSLTDENTQTSTYSATVIGKDIACIETTVGDTDTLGE